MPLSQNTIVEWPQELNHVLDKAHVAVGAHGGRYCRIDVDVDPDTLLLLNDFEGRSRHRQVRFRLEGHSECLVAEMNTLVGLGAASDPTCYIGKVRVSFHDIQDDSCE